METRRARTAAFLVAACVLISDARIELDGAHHSFGAEYDGEKPITIKGAITKIEWANPHCHVYIEAKEANDTVKSWKIEGYPQ